MIRVSFAWRSAAASLLAAALAVTLTTPAPAATRLLSDAWSSDAAPGEGYDRVLTLDPDVVYLGGLILNTGSNCIHGNGAVVLLQGESLWMIGYRNRLDVDEIVLVGGGSGPLSGGLHYGSGTKGHVRNGVFFGCTIGLRMEAIFATDQDSSVSSCIFIGNTVWGAMFHDVYTPSLATCVAWTNGASPDDDYARYCGCPAEDPEAWTPPGDAGCFRTDPMLVSPGDDPDTCDFHLLPGSPCWSSGTPAGTHIGAYPYAALPVATTSWGGIKSTYRSR